jgi:hypothetical protein
VQKHFFAICGESRDADYTSAFGSRATAINDSTSWISEEAGNCPAGQSSRPILRRFFLIVGDHEGF